MATIKYFCGATELQHVFTLKNARFRSIGGIPSKHNYFDGFERLAGSPADVRATLPVTRRIEYKSNPSLHKCDSRCRSAKGHSCECSCGGQYHGSE